MAWTYDLVSWSVSLGRWRSWQRASLTRLGDLGGRAALELAHGTADLQIDIAANGNHAIGLDLSRSMGKIAQAKLKRHGLIPRLVRASALRLPFASGAFPAIVSTFPTEFIFRAETIQEAYRVLRPKGRLVIVLNGMLTITTLVARALEWLYTVTGQRGSWPADAWKPFTDAGFETKLEVEEFASSKAWILVAQKPPGSPAHD